MENRKTHANKKVHILSFSQEWKRTVILYHFLSLAIRIVAFYYTQTWINIEINQQYYSKTAYKSRSTACSMSAAHIRTGTQCVPHIQIFTMDLIRFTCHSFVCVQINANLVQCKVQVFLCFGWNFLLKAAHVQWHGCNQQVRYSHWF